MTTTQTDIDKIIAQFEKKQCTPIRDRPNFKNLIQLKNELKTNAGSIRTPLGGGAHGHLGLILSPEEYETIAGTTPFVKPPNPGALEITREMTNYDQIRSRAEWDASVRLFDLTNNVEKALMNQLTDTLPEVYIQGFRNTITNTITDSVHEVLEKLFDNYGLVTADELEEVEIEFNKYQHDITQPLVVLWNKVTYLKEVGELAKIPYSEEQLISKALRIIRNTGDFEHAIKGWYKPDAVEKTWDNFKAYFDKALKELEFIRGNIKKGYMYQQANAMKEMQCTLDGVKDELLTYLDDHSQQQYEQQTINNVSSTTLTDLQNQMKQIAAQVATLQGCTVVPSTSGRSSQKQEYTGPAFWNENGFQYKYCYTHGVCQHDSQNCPKERSDHKKEATFSNRMGGSLRRFHLHSKST